MNADSHSKMPRGIITEGRGKPLSVVERHDPECSGLRQPGRPGRGVCSRLRGALSFDRVIRSIRLLSADRDPGLPAQGQPARDHRHHVGELSVHPVGHSGTWVCGNPGVGLLRRSWCSASIATVPVRCRSPSTSVRRALSIAAAYAVYHYLSCSTGRLSNPSPLLLVSAASHLFRSQYGSDRGCDFADGAQVAPADLGRNAISGRFPYYLVGAASPA